MVGEDLGKTSLFNEAAINVKKSVIPDIISKKQRIADLQSDLNNLCKNLFLKFEGEVRWNYQLAAEHLNLIFVEASPTFLSGEIEECEKHRENNLNIVEEPFFKIIVNQTYGISKKIMIIDHGRKTKIRNAIFDFRLYLNNLLNKHELESLNRNQQQRKES